jgi:hypothetical protein
MLKRPITYTDFNGIERTEDFYFNLSKAEVLTMEMSTTGGLAEMIQTIVAKQDMPAIISIFETIILKAYGEKSPDGKHFIKNDEVKNNFFYSAAYSVLFTELATDADAASTFMNAVIPAKEKEEVVALPGK